MARATSGQLASSALVVLKYMPRTRRIMQKTVPGGHIGLFMGTRTLKKHWPPISRWITA